MSIFLLPRHLPIPLNGPSGLRVSEVSKLNLDDLYFKNDDGYILLKDTKNREDWKVYLMEDTISLIQSYIALERDNSIKNKALFLTRRNTRISTRAIQNTIKKAGDSIGVKVHPHMLRHTCATQMRINGADIDTIKNQLRHRSYESTQIYIHAVDEVQKTNYKKYALSIAQDFDVK